MNDYLRKQVKLLKAMQDISYKELAEYVEMTQGSFYNWLKGHYDISETKQNQLYEVITNIKEC